MTAVVFQDMSVLRILYQAHSSTSLLRQAQCDKLSVTSSVVRFSVCIAFAKWSLLKDQNGPSLPDTSFANNHNKQISILMGGATQHSDKESIFGKLPQKRQLFFSDPQALQSGHVRFDRPGGAGPAYNGYKGALSVPPDWQN